MRPGHSLLFLLALSCTSPVTSPVASEPDAPAPASRDEDLAELRARLDEAQRARQAKDLAASRAAIAEAIESALTILEARSDSEAIALLVDLGRFAHDTGELRSAEKAHRRVLEVRSGALPADHPDLQQARMSLANSIFPLGDRAGARELFAAAVEAYERTLPPDHADLQTARLSLAVAMKSLGDLAGARVLEEQVLEVRERTLPADHPDLFRTRGNLAVTMKRLGDPAGARVLEEKVLEFRARTLPADHADLQKARANLANTLRALGDLAGAHALFEEVFQVFSRTLPDEHPDLMTARMNLAVTSMELGDLEGARALQEKVYAVRSRALPDDHPDVQVARQNLAGTMYALGDVAGARALFEKVLEVHSRTLPDDHPDLAIARQNLAVMTYAVGDLAAARTLFERVLEVQERTRSDDDLDLQRTRANLAVTMKLLGDLEGARALEERLIEINRRALPEDHPDLLLALGNLAATKLLLGDLDGAREIFEQVLEVRSRALPEDHPDLQFARRNLAWTCARLIANDPPGPSGALRQRCAELMGAVCRAQTIAARQVLFSSSAREAEERCERIDRSLGRSLSFAAGFDAFDPIVELERASFELGETTRGAALGSASLMRRAAGMPRYAELRDELRARSDELARLVQIGTTSDEFQTALAEREALERELVQIAREISGGSESSLDFDLPRLAGTIGDRDAVVAYRKYERWSFARGADERPEKSEEFLCAFVVRDRDSLTRVELGPLAPIEEAVQRWRGSLGIGADVRGVPASASSIAPEDSSERGRELRRRVFDPLRAALDGAEHVIVVLDDVLHLVPMDALPLDEPALLGDRYRIETRVTVAERLAPPAASAADQKLFVVGGVEYEAQDAGAERPGDAARVLRGGAWASGFGALPATREEARAIARSFSEQHAGVDAATFLEGEAATRERFKELAPGARWLHVATHGWFASESIRSWKDAEPLDRSTGLGMRASGEDQVKGMSPMLLCGLALAGANAPEDELGRMPGLVTAEEIAALDLSNCELAVLSACDTNVGERRAGQGVASLQKALQMAGARSVITSLWKVPDEATKELMLDFYRRLWVEKKPKGQALWEAKMKIRNAKDEKGRPLCTTRDWGAWVMTGESD